MLATSQMNTTPTIPLFSAALCLAQILAVTAPAADSWPRFLGSEQNNVVNDAPKLPVQWDSQKGIRWRTEVPGEGWSSPLVVGGRVWLTTATEEGHSLRALAFDYESGKLLKDVEVFRLEAVPPKHRRNSHASPTGLISGGRLYVHFGTNGTAALDAETGEVLWRQQTLKVDHQNGPGGSLTEHGNLLLVPCDGMDVQHEVALDKATGAVVWKSERSAKPFLDTLPADMRKAYGTPFLLQTPQGAVSLTTASTRLYALDPATGKELWYCNYGKGFSNVPLPATDGRTLVVCTGFMKPEVWGIKLEGAKGDISESHVLWKHKSAAPDQATPVLANGLVFTVSSGGIASCLDISTGDMVWRERLGSDFAATPLVANGLVYFADCAGVVTAVKAARDFEVVAKSTMPEGFMASPAVVGSSLVLRTKAALYRVE
jgi:outer membrane protein assembly factor BamB